MAPDELILNNLEGASVENLKSIDVWALWTTSFVLLNPDPQGPYLLEHGKKVLVPYRKVIEGKMRGGGGGGGERQKTKRKKYKIIKEKTKTPQTF